MTGGRGEAGVAEPASPESTSEPEAARTSAVVVEVCETPFALELAAIREVLRVPAITRLPFPPPSVLGVINVRGNVLPVLDLGDRLHGRPCSRQGRVLVVHDPTTRSDVALLVDRVVDLVLTGIPSERLLEEAAAPLPDGVLAGTLETEGHPPIALLNLQVILLQPKNGSEDNG